MALIPQIDILEDVDNTYLDITDVTGTYDANTNEGGYGGINPASSDVSAITLSVLFPGSTVPYVFNFVITSNVITSATVTDVKGIVTDITSQLLNLVFPWTANQPLRLYPKFFGDTGTNSVMPDGVYTFAPIYAGTFGVTPFSENASYDFAVVGVINNYIDNQLASLDADDFEERYQDCEKLMLVDFALDAVYSAMDVGYSTQAQGIIEYIQGVLNTYFGYNNECCD